MTGSKDVVAGIKEEELNALSEEIITREERISDILERIDRSVDRLPECYQADSCDELLRRYSEISSSYPVLKDNIRSYADDLKTLIVKMRESDQFLSTMVQGATEDARAQLRAVKSKYNVD